jgi:hypothetical protein
MVHTFDICRNVCPDKAYGIDRRYKLRPLKIRMNRFETPKYHRHCEPSVCIVSSVISLVIGCCC